MWQGIVNWTIGNSAFLQSVCEVVVALVALFTVGFAWHGLSTWKREFLGRKKIELAEDVLCWFYEAADVIEAIRSPLSSEGEGCTRQARDSESPEEEAIYNQAYITIERYNSRIELFSKLRSVRYRFKARFGRDSTKPIDALLDAVRRVRVSAHSLARLWLQLGKAKDKDRRESLEKKVEKHEVVIYFGEDEHDEIALQVQKAVLDMEAFCRTVIGGKS
ncbi:MAG: hypothetical protein IH624_11965 [Phycisphaerae bacterium]|nr:hypothetical protein [Phycisphaerae bacterium]